MEHGVEIGFHGAIEFVIADLVQRLARHLIRRVIHHDIDFAEAFSRLRHNVAAVFRLGYITGDQQRFLPCLFHQRRYL